MVGWVLRRRGAVLGASVVVVAVSCAFLGGGVSSAEPTAKAARTINVNDTINLSLVRKSGSTLYERGTATGTFPGTVTATFDTSNVTQVNGSITIYPTGGGSVTVNAVGYPQSLGTVARVTGNLAVRRGTGKYARALGSGTFSGTVNRRTWKISVTARATLRY